MSPTVGTYPINIGKARSATDFELTTYGFPLRLIINDTTVSLGSGINTYTMPRFVNEGMIMYTISQITGPNNGSTMQWSATGEVS